MTRDEFRLLMNNFKKARENNPLLSYWKWKANKYLDGTDYVNDTDLPEIVVTPDRNYVNLPFDQDAYNSAMLDAWGKLTRIGPEDVVDYLPIIGDIKGAYDIVNDFNNGNYLAGGIGLGLTLLPNFIEKPLRRIGKKLLRDSRTKNILKDNLLLTKTSVYEYLTPNELKNVKNNIANSLLLYSKYLNDPRIQERIRNTDYGNQYENSIKDFSRKVNTPNILAPYGDFRIIFDRYDNTAAAAVPRNPIEADFLIFNDYTRNATLPTIESNVNDIIKHEASHYLDRSIDTNLSTNYNNWLADTNNMLSFEEWLNQGIADKYIPNAMSEGIDFNTLSKEDLKLIIDKARLYYKYISDPTEIHAYLGEVTRNNFANGQLLFPYSSYEELYDAYENPHALSVLSLYKDKNRLLNLLKNDLWMLAPGVLLLSNEEDKSN